MSVKPTTFTGGLWDYIHSDYPPVDNSDPDNPIHGGHTGQIDPATITYAKNPDGTDNTDFILVICPEHPTMGSFWPIGGGEDPRLGQMLHLKINLSRATGRMRSDPVVTLEARIEELEPGRYCLTDEDIAEVMGE